MINPPQVRPEEPIAVTPHGGICGGKSQQWLSYPTAICIVCTTEAEFVADVNTRFWLSAYEIPRICLLSELLEFLEIPDLREKIQTHPAFVRFVPSCNS